MRGRSDYHLKRITNSLKHTEYASKGHVSVYAAALPTVTAPDRTVRPAALIPGETRWSSHSSEKQSCKIIKQRTRQVRSQHILPGLVLLWSFYEAKRRKDIKELPEEWDALPPTSTQGTTSVEGDSCQNYQGTHPFDQASFLGGINPANAFV